VTAVKRELRDKLLQNHPRRLLQLIGTQAASPRSAITNTVAQMKTAIGEEVSGAVNMTIDKHGKFQVCVSDAETETTTCSMADRELIENQP